MLTYLRLVTTMLLCIVDYYSKLPVMKVDSLAAKDLVLIAKMIFAKYELPKKSFHVSEDFSFHFVNVIWMDLLITE